MAQLPIDKVPSCGVDGLNEELGNLLLDGLKESSVNFVNKLQFTKNISLKLVEIQDADFILSLRLNEERNKYLSAIEGSVSAQKKWISNYKEREAVGDEYYFIIQDKYLRSIGTVRMYDFIGDSFCWGSWITTKDAPLTAGLESLLTIYELGFYKLNFSSSHFDVRKENKKVIKFHLSTGARIVDEDGLNYYLNLNQESYLNFRKKYSRFLL